METNHLEKAARKKLREKNLDLIIGNGPATFGSGKIRPLWIEKTGGTTRFAIMRKKELAKTMANFVLKQGKGTRPLRQRPLL